MVLCSVCKEIPLYKLPFEDEEAWPHCQNLDDLARSSKNCSMCSLINEAVQSLQADLARQSLEIQPGIEMIKVGQTHVLKFGDR